MRKLSPLLVVTYKESDIHLLLLNENAKNIPECHIICTEADAYSIWVYFVCASPFTNSFGRDYIFSIKILPF